MISPVYELGSIPKYLSFKNLRERECPSAMLPIHLYRPIFQHKSAIWLSQPRGRPRGGGCGSDGQMHPQAVGRLLRGGIRQLHAGFRDPLGRHLGCRSLQCCQVTGYRRGAVGWLLKELCIWVRHVELRIGSADHAFIIVPTGDQLLVWSVITQSNTKH